MSTGRDFICRVLSPLIAVAASPDADDLVKLNNLPSVADFLRPFGSRVAQVQVHDVQGHASTLERFPVRFRDMRQLDRIDANIINRAVLEYLKSHAKGRPTLPSIKSKDDVEKILAEVKMDELTPWYTDYRNCVCKYIGTSEFETFNHAAAYLVVVSTASSDPVAAAQQVLSDCQSAYTSDKPYNDPSIPKYCLLLHDEYVAPRTDVDTILTQLKKVVPTSFMVKINSVPHSSADVADALFAEPPPAPTVPAIWDASQVETACMLDQAAASLKSSSSASISSGKDSIASPVTDEGFPVFKEKADTHADPLGILSGGRDQTEDKSAPETQRRIYGMYLTLTDFAAVEEFVKQLVGQEIVKHMETSVQQWNEQVASNRRGLTGRLNRLVGMKYFGGGSKSQTTTPVPITDKSGATIFPHNAPEIIMRRLADYAFMLRDYRLAFGTYDSVRKDFQNHEKFQKYFSATQEMLGLTILMAEGIGKGSVESYLDAAVAGYQEAKIPLYSARAAMLYYEMLRQRSLFREAAPLLIRMTGEDSDMRSALFLEQASLSFLQVDPPMIRKYAFHLILAGHRFSKCGQRAHAYRCYMSALDVYGEKHWSLVEDHVHFTLGRQCFHLGEFGEAAKFFLKLLRASRQSATQQSAYLREFLHLYKQYAAKAPKEELRALPPLPIPEIQKSSILVSLTESHSGQPTQVAESDDAWDAMESELCEEGYRSGPRTLPNSKGKTTCAVGEPVYVTFGIRNPMNVPIQLNNVSLECQYGDNGVPVTDLKWSPETPPPDRVHFEELDLENVGEMALDGDESRKVQLRIFPKREGDLRIAGVRFTLCGVVPSYYEFPTKHANRSDKSAQLSLTVTSPMPVLDVIFHSFPNTLLSGEVVRAVIEINNKGNRGLRNLRLKTSHPSFFYVGESQALDALVYASHNSPKGGIIEETFKTGNMLFNVGTATINLPVQDASGGKGGILAPGMTTIVPLWVRGDKVGKHNFRFLFGYQSEDRSDKIGYRTLRFSMPTNVQPSLRINAFTRPSGRVLDEFILGVEVENISGDGSLVLNQVTSQSPTWVIRPIDEGVDGDTCTLQPRETVFKYFRFTRGSHSEMMRHAASIPELLTMQAIERLLLGESPSKLNAPELSMHMSSIALSSTAVSCNTLPFHGLSTTSRLQWRVNQLLSQYPGLLPRQLEELFTLYFTDDVDLSVIWGTPDTGRTGHQYIMGINLGLQAPLQGLQAGLEPLATAARAAAGKALFETTVREKRALITSLLKSKGKDVSPMRVILTSKDEHRHDFNNEHACMIPVTLVIGNTSRANAAKYTLRASAPDAGEEDSATQLNAMKVTTDASFCWLGATHVTGRLQPEEETSVTFMACFQQPGVYNVNRWQLNIAIEAGIKGNERDEGRKEAAASYVQTPNLPHWITILGT